MEWQPYKDTICTTVTGHIGLEAIGSCSCGNMTPCCNQVWCDACAKARGVCAFCNKKLDFSRDTDPEVETPMLMAMLRESTDVEERVAAVRALRLLGVSDVVLAPHCTDKNLQDALGEAERLGVLG